MTKKRRLFIPSFKAKIALEAVRETKTIAELYEQIGRLKMQLEWLTKKVSENS